MAAAESDQLMRSAFGRCDGTVDNRSEQEIIDEVMPAFIRDMHPDMRKDGMFKDDGCVSDVIRAVFGADNMTVDSQLRGFVTTSEGDELLHSIPVLGAPGSTRLNLHAIDMAGMTNIAEHIARTASSEKRHSRAQKTMDDMMMVNGHLPAPIIIHAKPRRHVSYCVHVVAYPQAGINACHLDRNKEEHRLSSMESDGLTGACYPMKPAFFTHQQLLDSMDRLRSKYYARQAGKKIPYTQEDLKNLQKEDSLSFSYDTIMIKLQYVAELEEWVWSDFHCFIDKADLFFPSHACSSNPASGDLRPFWGEFLLTNRWSQLSAPEPKKKQSMHAAGSIKGPGASSDEEEDGSGSDGEGASNSTQVRRRRRKKGAKKKKK